MKKNKKIAKSNKVDAEIAFQAVLIIIITPLFALLAVAIFGNGFYKKIYNNNEYIANKDNIKILTDRSLYFEKDKMVLAIENNSKEPIYFEPCEYLNNFEKKIDGKWKFLDGTFKDKVYDNSEFEKRKNSTKCNINLPNQGEGIFRAVVKIYYACERPGENMCEESKNFYSNEFEVRGLKW